MEPARHSGGAAVTVDAPAANTVLWTVYLRQQIRTWIDPLGLAPDGAADAVARPLADMAAAVLSGWMSFIADEPVRALYEANKPAINEFVQHQAIDPDAIEIPAPFTRAPYLAGPTQVEPWAITTLRDREPALSR